MKRRRLVIRLFPRNRRLIQTGDKGFLVLDPSGIFGGGGHGIKRHLRFRIPIINEIDQNGLRRFRQYRRAKFRYAMMGKDNMLQNHQ